jgi:hypothetical protein
MRKFWDFQFKWAENVGLKAGCDYLTRYVLVLFGFSLRVHHWTNDDDPRHMHDHAWWFLTLVLRGGYTDISQAGEGQPVVHDHLSAGSIRFRPALHRHSVMVDNGGAWTLVLTGPRERHWGFWVPGRNKVLPFKRYFKKYGHHQCN